MSKLEQALEVSALTRIIVDMQEKKKRLEQLNKYDHEEPDPRQAFFVEFGGRSTHVKYFPNNNDIGDEITAFFVELFGQLEAEAEKTLSKLLA
ncbi:MAG: hypothetical protein ABIG61_07375 [Planctomycetota bacterium]